MSQNDEIRTPSTFQSTADLSATPTMDDMLSQRTTAAGGHSITDATADPFETVRTASELFDKRAYKAAADLLEGLDGTPEGSSRHVRELLARSYYHSAQLTKAADAASALLDDDPTNVDAATVLTRALERSSRHDEARRARRLAESLGADI